MSEQRKILFPKRDSNVVSRWFASHKAHLFLAILLPMTLLLTAWDGGGMHGGGGGWWNWSMWGNTPTMEILEVEKDATVSFEAHGFPEGTELELTMGLMWSRGIDGYVVDTITIGEEDPFIGSFDIPTELADEARISIRLESDNFFPYYAFNWFFNNDTTLPNP